MPNKITIAIDGYSSCGKSTLAKDLAKELNYIFIDSGAMYRGITLYALQHDLIKDGEVNEEALNTALPHIELHFEFNANGAPELVLNGVNVADEIRLPDVSSMVSKIASIKEVRAKLVEAQRAIGKNGGIVMDGRDIGSVVFPNAELKLFITASIPVRTERRYLELSAKGVKIDRSAVEKNLLERDHLDSTREESPLTQVADAIVIDNSNITKTEQLQAALKLAKRLIEE